MCRRVLSERAEEKGLENAPRQDALRWTYSNGRVPGGGLEC